MSKRFKPLSRITLRSFVLLLILLGYSCDTGKDHNDPASADAPMDRVLQIRMHDFAILNKEVEKVIVEIKKVEVHHSESGWMTVSETARKYNLLELQNGITAVILEKPLPLGPYTQIRLELNANNEIFVSGRPYRLKVPSGEETGIKLITPFEIKKGKMVEVTFDFDAEKSVNLTKGQGFLLKPVIKVEKIAEYDVAGIITSAGGNITAFDGALNIQILPGALNESIMITADETDVSDLPAPDARTQLVGKAYTLEPDGQTFSKSILLMFKYNEEDLATKGSEVNLSLYRYDAAAGRWVKISSYVAQYANTVYAWVTHFSLYALYVSATCSDGVQNYDETGIDCGGSCPAQCINCNGYDYGEGVDSDLYSFGHPSVIQAANEALTAYAAYKGVDVSTLDTPDEKMEAVAYYVHRYMAYMQEEGWLWSGPQSAAKTIIWSPYRVGWVHVDWDSAGNSIYEERTCAGSPTYFRPKEYNAKFCGDCEDFAILRGSLMRHLGVANYCAMNTDYHADWDHPEDSPSAPAPPYDYETANDLFLPESATGKKSHGFNIVIYKNKYRIMDYSNLGERYFLSSDDWDSHRADNIWNDHFGQHWSGFFMLPRPLSVWLMHNWPGPGNPNKCYEPGKNYWTHRTLYADICP